LPFLLSFPQGICLGRLVNRNLQRFPPDFTFRLKPEEIESINPSQSVTGSQKHRDPRFPPRVFTQEGVAMLSGHLRSQRAIDVNQYKAHHAPAYSAAKRASQAFL
jgi:ORF6N domain